MLLLKILFSLLLSNTLAIENGTEVLKNGTEVCTCATKSELPDLSVNTLIYMYLFLKKNLLLSNPFKV